MNSVFCKFFSIDAVEAFEPEAAALGPVPRALLFATIMDRVYQET
jgi:hypothetical protein